MENSLVVLHLQLKQQGSRSNFIHNFFNRSYTCIQIFDSHMSEEVTSITLQQIRGRLTLILG